MYLLVIVVLVVAAVLGLVFGVAGGTVLLVIGAVVLLAIAGLLYWNSRVTRRLRAGYAKIREREYPRLPWRDTEPRVDLLTRFNALDFGTQVAAVDPATLDYKRDEWSVTVLVRKTVGTGTDAHPKKQEFKVQDVRTAEHLEMPLTRFVHRGLYSSLVVTTPIPQPRPYLTVRRAGRPLSSNSPNDLDLQTRRLDDRFLAESQNAQFIDDVTGSGLVRFLHEDARAEHFGFQIMGGGVTAWAGRTGPDDRLHDALADYLVQVVRHIPQFVWTR